MKTVIIDYSSGNLHSALKSFQRMADETGAGDVVVASDPAVVRTADRIVLPGVGAYADCRAGLVAIPGLFEAIEERVIRGGIPFIGICVGQQLMEAAGWSMARRRASAGSPAMSCASRPPIPRSRSLTWAGTH